MAGNFGQDYPTKDHLLARYSPVKKQPASLKKGGMSLIHLVYDKVHKRPAVLKFYDPSVAGFNQDTLDNLAVRFDLEIEVSTQLHHPNSITVYEVGRYGGSFPFIVMEYIEGRNLARALAHVHESGEFNLEEFLLMLYQICDPLETGHEKGIIHRDLKPGNILLGKYGEIKICDWGLAKKIDPSEIPKDSGKKSTSRLDLAANVHTLPGFRMGTLSYLTPEQIREESVDQRTDVFLLTAILYEAVVGEPPYSSENVDCLRRERDDDHSFDTSKLYIPGVREIILTGMAVEKEDRYQTVGELKRAVKDVLDDLLNDKIKIKPVADSGLIGKILQRRQETQQERLERMILSDIVKKWATPLTREERQARIERMADRPTERPK
ncbi:serine/threonine protein kinase [Candidatus Woesearchaeota archaeon]|nr:serine/threonine protein kinase [Candidatus Woesearchaeota archaeon]